MTEIKIEIKGTGIDFWNHVEYNQEYQQLVIQWLIKVYSPDTGAGYRLYEMSPSIQTTSGGTTG